MANDISGRPWRLDTAKAYGQVGAVLWPAYVKVEHFEWTNYNAQGQKCVLKDQNGRIVWSPTGASDFGEIRSAKIGWVNGLVLDSIDAGVVTVYVD